MSKEQKTLGQEFHEEMEKLTKPVCPVPAIGVKGGDTPSVALLQSVGPLSMAVAFDDPAILKSTAKAMLAVYKIWKKNLVIGQEELAKIMMVLSEGF